MRKHFLILMLLTLLPFAAWAQHLAFTEKTYDGDAHAFPTVWYDAGETTEITASGVTVATNTQMRLNGWTKGGSSFTQYEGAGEYVVQIQRRTRTSSWSSWSSWGNYSTLTLTVNKGTNVFTTDPVGKLALKWTGTTYVLIETPGAAKWGAVEYSLDNISWSSDYTTIARSDAADYTIYYRVEGNDNYDLISNTTGAKIAPTTISVTFHAYNKVYGEPDATLDNIDNTTLYGGALQVTGGDLAWADAKQYLTLSRVEFGENVGTYGYQVEQTSGKPNFVAYIDYGGSGAKVNIQQKDATLTSDDASKLYGNDDPTFTATCPDLVKNSVVQDDMTNIGLTFTREEGENVGTYIITPAVTSLNYNWTINATGKLSIDKRPLTLQVANAEKTYGADDPEFALANTPDYAFEENATTIGLEITRSNASVQAVGTYDDVLVPAATTAAADNYAITPVNGQFKINQADLHVNVANAEKTYGSADPAFELVAVDASQFKYGDDISVVTPNFDREPGNDVKDGGYAITATPTAANYTVVVDNNGVLTINPFALDLVAANASKTYGDADPAFALSNTPDYQYTDDATIIGLSFSRSNDDVENAGTYNGVIVPAATSTNYTYNVTNGNFVINPRATKLTAEDKNKVYGDDDPTFTAVCDNLASWDDIAAIAPTFTREEGENVGTYAITPASTNANYDFTPVDGTLEILVADLELTAVDKSKEYGKPDPLFETTVTGGAYKNGDTFATIGGSFIREKLGTADGELVGHYYIQPVAATAGNYNINLVKGDLEITKALATLTAEDKSKTYGEADPEFTVVAEGLTNGDDLTTIGAGATRAAGEDAAEYAISPKGNTHFEDNYDFTYVDGTMKINPAAVTVTAVDDNKVYGAADPAEFTATAEGLKFTDQVSDLGLTITRAEGENVGHYAITPSAGTNTNYTYTYNDGDFEITKKNATLTAVPKLKVYGEEDPEFTATCEQLTNGDDMTTIGLSFTRMPGENVGFYAITPNATSLNYNWTFVPDNLEITPAYLVLTADNASKTYGAADPEFALAEIPNYKNGDDATSIGLTITRTNAAVEAAGTYEDVIVPAATSLNYEYEINAADFTIGKKAATLTAENKSKVYGNAEPTYTVVAEGLAGDDNLSTIGWSTSRAEGEHFGTYAITPAATSENYEWTFEDGTLTIEKRGLLYALSNKEVEYNGKAVTTEGVYTLSSGSFADGESLAGLGISFDFFDEIKNAGTYTADKLNVDYNENIDYDINFTGNATIKVNQKPFTEEMIKNFAASKKYTGFAQNPGYTVEDKPEAENIIAESDYTVAIAKAGAEVTKDEVVEAGTYTYTFAPVAEGNYKGEAIAKNFAIGGMDFTDALLEAWVDETTYNAEAQPAEYTLSYENLESEVVTLNEGTDFTVAITVGEDAATEVKNADVYTYTFTGVGNYAGNFTKTYTINKAVIDPEGITAPVAVEGLVYSAADQTLIAAGAATTQFGEVLPVLYNLADGEFAEELPQAKNAGNYEVNFKVDGGQNYIDVVAGPVANVKIAKAPVVVTAESVERTYNGVAGLDGLEPELIFSSFKGEDTKDVVAGTAPVSVKNANKNVGTYDLIVNTENLSADNYSFAAAEIQGTLTINKADLTFTFNDRDEEDAYLIKKEYGKNDPDFKAFIEIDGNIESEASFLNNINVYRVKTDEAVGTYDDAIAISLKTTTAAKNLFANYNVTNEDKGDFEITKAALTIALKADEGKVYDAETVNSVEVTYDKLVVTSLAAGDDIQTAITTLPTATIDNAKNVGTYAIKLDGAVAPNYEISYIDARYVITAAPLSEFNVQTQVIRVGDDKDAINSALWQVTGIQGDEDKDAIFQLVVDPSLYDEDGKINAAAGEYISGLVLEVIDADAAANYSGFENVDGNLTVVDETGGTAIVLYDDQEQFDNLVTADGTTLDVTVVVGRNQAIGKYDGKWHADEWNTMVLPFDVTPKELSNAFGYAIVNLVDPSRTTEGNVAFKLNLTQTIPANTPFTIRTDEDIEEGTPILFAGKTIVAPASAQVSVDAGCGYSFVGVYNTFTIDNTHPNYHFLVNGGWKHIGASSSNTYDIVPFNCYVDQSATSSVRPEDVTFTFEDENGNVTAIKTVNVDAEGMFAEGWFTLDGKKLNAAPAQKGVYIHNGKKTVIK